MDCTIFANSMRREYALYLKTFSAKRQKLPETLDPEKIGILIREVKAHKEGIVCMNPIAQENGGLITCSLDKRVRLWSSHLDLWGTID